MSDVVLRMSLAHVSTLAVAARSIADTARGLGLGGSETTQLEALMSEALTAVIADSFTGMQRIDVDVTVSHGPGAVEIVLSQHGAPSTYVNGPLPERLETLLSLGYADSLQFASDGVRGSELRITRTLGMPALMDDSAFVASAGEPEAVVALDDLTIRPLTPDDAIGVARLYFRTYGYTKIGSPWIYEPADFRFQVETGRHVAVVAATPSGRIVGHAGLLRSRPDSVSASGGPLAVDPDYREQGLSGRMSMAILPTLMQLELRGMYSMAVTAHPASQKAAQRIGGAEVGLVLGRQPAELDFRGFDGPHGIRRAVMVLYSSFGTSPRSTVHAPARYRDLIASIYEHARLPRDLEAHVGRLPDGLAAQSRLGTELTSATKYAQVNVEAYGADFVPALQGLLRRFEREGFEMIAVHLPLADPLTSHFGAGLGEFGLSFQAIYPEQDRGDELVLGACFTEQDPDTIATASEFGAWLKAEVLADRDRILSSQQARLRSRASMARILDSL